jgi:hypothetical protein
MYFYIQELKMKREVKGRPKEIILGTKNVDGILVNTYTFSQECFKRTIKKSYRISLHESYREDGKIKKRQCVVATLNYYDIAESREEDSYDSENSLYYRLFSKLDLIIESFNIQDDKKDEYIEDLYDSLAIKIDPLFDKIRKEFSETEEGRIFLKHKKLINTYEDAKRKFLLEYDAFSQEYDICYDLYGNLTNESYLKKIKSRSSYEKEQNSNYKSCNTIYTINQRKILKQFYRTLAKFYHPDANIGQDTSEHMKLLNELKNDWRL